MSDDLKGAPDLERWAACAAVLVIDHCDDALSLGAKGQFQRAIAEKLARASVGGQAEGLREAAALLRRRNTAYGHPGLSHHDTGIVCECADILETEATKLAAGQRSQEGATITPRGEKRPPWEMTGPELVASLAHGEYSSATVKAKQAREVQDVINAWQDAAASDHAHAQRQAERAEQAEAALAAKEAELARVIAVAGEAVGTDPALRSSGCVDALATWAGTLQRDLSDVRAQLAAQQETIRSRMEALVRMRISQYPGEVGLRWLLSDLRAEAALKERG